MKQKPGHSKAFRRMTTLLLCVTLFLSVLGAANAAKASSTATVTASVLNLRAEPNTGSSIVDRLSKGTRMEVHDQVSSNWYSCTANGKSGYVHASYIRFDGGAAPAPREQASSASGTATVTASTLNFRNSPSTGAGIIGTLSRGTTVTLLEKANAEWYKCTADGKTGYLHGAYLSLQASAASSIPAAATPSSPSAPTLSGLLKMGSRGEAVLALQNALAQAGYFNTAATAYFGSVTYDSVKRFQKDQGLKVDGIVGQGTWGALFGGSGTAAPAPENTEQAGATPETPTAPAPASAVELVNWAAANTIWPRGAVGTLTDVRTGKTFQVKRLGGTLHMDIEPLTEADTAVMKECYGGVWSWDRRPVVAEYNGRRLAASMNGMPHGASDQTIFNNNFEGMVCVHFVDSHTHGSGSTCPLHQAAIQEAFNAMK